MRSFWLSLVIGGLLIFAAGSADFSAVSSKAMAEIFAGGQQRKLLSVIDLKEARRAPQEQRGLAETAPLNRSVSITEIVFDPEGADIGKEFIKLHNYSAYDIDLKGWSLRFIRAEANLSTSDVDRLAGSSSLAKIGSSKDDKTVIKAGGFFLVGLNKYSATPEADVKRVAALPNAGGVVLLTDSSGEVVTSVRYGEVNQ